MLRKIFVAAIASCTMNAFAADNQGNFYAGLDAGSSKINDLSGRMGSVGGFIGYQMTKSLSVEGGYRRLATLELLGVDANLTQSAISLIGTTDLGNNFDFFGRVGYNKIAASAEYSGRRGSASDSGSLFGIGFAYNVNTNFSVRLEAQRPAKDMTNFSAAMIWKF
ncbi:porin family protein [Undibacterium fentianense]|uniref:Porin family protein n=1 Tax=Undibacterium fentianense TaxID=2828728 RepID=A0A941IBG6_9BURK|nr:porin family protein [Undibacterium fentianense]MBR7799039.1 porin family protein [Undibacterium fentianense]